MGFQGNPQIPTPNLDSLAEGGVRFTQGYATASICSPSRAGLMVGRHQSRVGHETNPPWGPRWKEYGLPLKEKTMADRLKALGYATAAIGKWHLGYKPEYWPTERGFDEYYGHLDNVQTYFEPEILDTKEQNPRHRTVKEPGYYSTFAFGERAREFIAGEREEPWFLYLTFYNQHAPLQAPAEYKAPFDSIPSEKRRTYAGMMRTLDEEVGRILDTLRATGQFENTLIFFISDNGGAKQYAGDLTNLPLRGQKLMHTEGGFRVPYVIHWPDRIEPREAYTKPVSTLDVMPTALAAAGARIDPAWQLEGVDLIPYIEGSNPDAPHETLYWHRGSFRTIRHGDWKLLFREGHPEQLYNLAEDPTEQNNLYEQEPARVRRMQALLRDIRRGEYR